MASEELNLQLVNPRKTPVVLQSEMMECGLACVSMAMAVHGRRIDLSVLRARYPASLRGLSVTRLGDIAEAEGFLMNVYEAEADQMAELKLPGVLFWKKNHFVVLVNYRPGRSVVLHDPAVGVRKLKWAEFVEGFSGVAAELEPLPTMQKAVQTDKLPVATLLRKTEGYAGVFTKIFLVALVLEGLLLLSPLFLQNVIDDVLPVRDDRLLWSLVAGFTGLALINTGMKIAQGWLGMALIGMVAVTLKFMTFNHMLRLPMVWFEKRGIGTVAARFRSLDNMRTILSNNVLLAVVDAVVALVMVAVLFAYEWRLAFVAVGFAAVTLALALLMYSRFALAASEAVLADAEESRVLVESVTAMGAVKMFSQEMRQLANYRSKLMAATNRLLDMVRVKTWHQSAQHLLAVTGDIAVVAAAAWLVLQGTISLGVLFGFYAYKQILAAKVASLGEAYFNFRLLSVYTTNAGDILLSATEPWEGRTLTCSPHPSLRFENVSFRYDEADQPTLQDFSLTVSPGEVVGITGPSGGGKSTLVKLLTGALLPASGAIRLDEVDIVGVAPRNVRNHLSVVLQSDHLLSGTLTDNITMFETAPDMERVRAAARDAGVLDDILAIPTRFDTIIQGHAPTLSGGQKQRVLLARAFYKNAPVLVLDEATSSLDIAVEIAVCDAIRRKGLTTLMVAHRQETLARCDRVVHVGAARAPMSV